MADVLVNFIGSGDQLQPAEDALDSLIKKEGQVAETWKNTAAVMAGTNKQTVDSTSTLAKSIEQLGVAAKSMDKVVIGGAYKQYLKEIQAQLGLTNKELIAYILNARKAAQASIISAATDQEAKEFALSVQVMNEQLRALGVEEDGTTIKTKSFKAELNAAKLELKAMVDAGKEGTAEFAALEDRIGELTDRNKDLSDTFSRLGSDTKNIDGLISAASGVAGGFAAAQGAMALFGDESEATQQALLKVNAAMSILQGLQALGNVLQKESAANLLLTSLFRKQDTVATVAQTVAQTANNVETGVAVVETGALAAAEVALVPATEAAVVAQAELNAVMLLNPAGILVGAVLALIGAYALLSGPSKEQRDNQAAINDAIQEGTVHINNYLDAIDHQTQKLLADAKLQGKSIIETAQIEGKAGQSRVDAIFAAREAAAKAFNEARADDEESIKAKAKLYDVYVGLDKQYEDEYRALVIKGKEFRKTVQDEELKSFIAFQDAKVLATIAGSDAERRAQIEATKNIAAEREKSADFIALTDGEKAKIRAEDERKINELNLANFQHYLKNRTAAEEANLADSKRILIQRQVDSIESIKKISQDEIDAINKRRKEALADPTLNDGERRKINAEANLAIAQQETELQAKLLAIKQAGLNAQLILAKKGSEDEYLAKVASLDNQQKIELAATELTQEQVNEINAKFQKQREEALRGFLEQQLQDLISFDNAQLDRFGNTEDEKLTLTLKRLDEQKRIELLNAADNAAKIAEIEAKYLKLSTEAKLASIETIKNKQLAAFDAINAQDLKRASDNQTSPDTNEKQKEAAVEKERLLAQERLQIEFDALEKGKQYNENYNVDYQNLLNKRVAIDQDASGKTVAIKKAEIDRLTAMTDAYFSFLNKSLDAFVDNKGLKSAITGLEGLGTGLANVFGKLKVQVDAYNKIIESDTASEDEKADARLKKFEAQKQAYIAAATAAIQAVADITNSIYAAQAEKRQQQLDADIAALEKSKDRELAVKNLTEQQKADINQRYANKERQLKLQAFEADKRAKRSQAIINAALGATLAFAEYPWPYSIVVAAITAGLAAIEISAINSAQPGFKGGVIDLKGPGTATSDSISAKLSAGESVMTAKETKDWKGALQAMRDGKFPDWVQNYKTIVYPQDLPAVNMQNGDLVIDYKKLGQVIGENVAASMPSHPYIQNTIDSDGLHQFLHHQDSVTEFKNKRYSMT